MKKSIQQFVRLLTRLAIVLLLLYISISLYLQFFAKDHIQKSLSYFLQRDVHFSRIVYRFPFEVQMYEVRVDDILFSEGLSVRFSKDILKGQDMVISKLLLVRPRVYLKKILAGKTDGPLVSVDSVGGTVGKGSERDEPVWAESGGQSNALSAEGQGLAQEKSIDIQKKTNILKIKRIVIKDGQVAFPYVLAGREIDLKVDQISLQARHLSYPFLEEQIQFQLTGHTDLPGEVFPESELSAEGWLDMLGKNMDSVLALKNNQQGKLLNARVLAQNNHVTVTGEIHSGDMIKQKRAQTEPRKVEDMAAKALSLFGVNIGVSFYFETKLDDFKISNISFTGKVGKPAGGDSSQPVQSD